MSQNTASMTSIQKAKKSPAKRDNTSSQQNKTRKTQSVQSTVENTTKNANQNKKTSNTTSLSKPKNVAVEVMRIIACCFVIILHSHLPFIEQGELFEHRVYVDLFAADAVAIFWMISGFFMFGQSSYSKMLKKALTKGIIPVLFIVVGSFLLMDWVRGDVDLITSITSKTPKDWNGLFNMISMWSITAPDSNVVFGGNISWFLMVYTVIVLIWPLLNCFVQKFIKDNKKNQIIFVVTTCALLGWNSLTNNHLLNINFNTFNVLLPSIIFVVWGYILYQYRLVFAKHKWTALIAVGVFISLFVLRCFVGVEETKITEVGPNIGFWWSPGGYIGATAFVIFCMALIPQSSSGFFAKIISIVGGATMTIYMIHILVQQFLWEQFNNAPLEFFLTNPNPIFVEPWKNYTAYMIVTTLEIFAVALFVALITNFAKGKVKFVGKAITSFTKNEKTITKTDEKSNIILEQDKTNAETKQKVNTNKEKTNSIKIKLKTT